MAGWNAGLCHSARSVGTPHPRDDATARPSPGGTMLPLRCQATCQARDRKFYGLPLHACHSNTSTTFSEEEVEEPLMKGGESGGDGLLHSIHSYI